MRKTRGKTTLAKRKSRRAAKPTTPRELGHKRRFDQLLDDAIFGVKKNPRG